MRKLEDHLFDEIIVLLRVNSASGKLPNVVLIDGTGTEEQVFVRVRNLVEERLLP